MPTETQFPKRGAKPSPPHVLAAAKRHVAAAGAPENFTTIPQTLSFWGNYYHGDCITAEEAFAKACNRPEIFISESEAITWASKHGVLENAYFTDVLDWMKTGGFLQNSYIYDDGPYDWVDFTNSATLQSAISQGPVKLGVSGDQLNSVWRKAGGSAAGGVSGWFATAFLNDSHVDHCVSLCGYGTMAWLARQLNVQPPAGVDGTQPGYALFTWDSIGVIDVPSLLAITGEAWLRTPTTIAKLGKGELLSYGDAGTPGNVSDPVVVGYGGWSPFPFLFAGRDVSGENHIYAVNQNGQLLAYDDDGGQGDVADPVVVGFGGWLDFKSLFAGANVSGENRIYAANQSGQLLSYGDDGNPGNVSDPVVVGFGGWLDFKFLFAGKNLLGQNRIYAVVE
jgi:hypothetical protein